MSALRIILATVREEVGPEPSDAELLRAIGDAAGEIAERKLGSVTTTTPDIYAPIVEEACAKVARDRRAQ